MGIFYTQDLSYLTSDSSATPEARFEEMFPLNSSDVNFDSIDGYVAMEAQSGQNIRMEYLDIKSWENITPNTIFLEGWFYMQQSSDIDIIRLASIRAISDGQIAIARDTDEKVQAYRVSHTGSGSALLAESSAGAIKLNQWQYWQVKAYCADVNGNIVVRIDGVEYINVTADTQHNSADDSLDRIRFDEDMWIGPFFLADDSGSIYNALPSIGTPPSKIQVLMPNAVGNSSDWTPDSGDNYTNVDEKPLSETDKVASATNTHKDTYGMEAAPSDIGTIYAVCPFAVAENDDATARQLNTVVRGGSSETAGTDTSLKNAALRLVEDVVEVNPADSAAWESADIGSVEVGMELSV